MTENSTKPVTYRDAGVDIDQASRSLAAIARFAQATATSGNAGDIGHFGGVFRLPAGEDRLLVASADGIGTKIKLAFVLGGDAHRGVGGDLVNHCTNDILACGARPLFFLDYIAMGRLDPVALENLVEGMTEACKQSGTALIGGETAEMPGLYADGEYDAAGFIVGEVAPNAYIDGSQIQPGDLLIGLPSSGLHTNGYSLARMALGLNGDADHDLPILHQPLPDGNGASIGEALMAPHLNYFPQVWPLIEERTVKGIAHITGGGLLDNVPRMLPTGMSARLDQSLWTVNPIFTYLVETGNVDARERYRAFNMGIGLVLAIAPGAFERIVATIPEAMVIGVVSSDADEPQVTIAGIANEMVA